MAQETPSASTTPKPTPKPTPVLLPRVPSEPVTKGQRVFTAGHSFHHWVAPILEEMAKSAGLSDHQVVGVQKIGASQVITQWLAGTDDGRSELKDALAAGEVDVLTVSPIYLPDVGIGQFANYGYKYNKDFRLTVLMLWVPNDEFVPHFPYKHRKYEHNDTKIPDLQAAQDAYDKAMNDFVAEMNGKIGAPVVVTVPAGQAVVALREKVAAGQAPGIKTQNELFADAWGHPHEIIEALEGYCEFAVIYRRSPVGLPVPSILKDAKDTKIAPADLEPLNKLLQELAWAAVLKDPQSGVVPKEGP